jgi:hypothetical protein
MKKKFKRPMNKIVRHFSRLTTMTQLFLGKGPPPLHVGAETTHQF